MSQEITVTVRGLREGETPVAVIEIPLTGERCEHTQQILDAVFGTKLDIEVDSK